MSTIESRHIRLVTCKRSDLYQLYTWRIQEEFMQYCTPKGDVTFREFSRELREDSLTDRHEQLMIKSRSIKRSIGTIYAYGGNPEDATVFVSVYIDPRFRGRGYGAYATAAYAHHLFSSRGVKVLWLDVYNYNTNVLKMLHRIGATSQPLATRISISGRSSREVNRFVFTDEQAENLSRFL